MGLIIAWASICYNSSMGDKYIVDEEAVKVWITDIYGISVQSLTKLDLGADIHSTLYRVESTDSKSYFLKFRTGNFEEISVSIPYFLTKSGIPHLVAPIETTARTLFAQYQTSWGMIYPWVDAKTSAEQPMSASEWQQFGSTLQAIHTAVLPENITAHLKVETFSTHWLDQFTLVLTHELQKTHADDLSSVVRGFLSEKKSVLDDLHIKTRELHSRISGKNFQKVLCHADLHAANVLVDTAENIHIVDWDNPILAPIERDLMFVG
ncbi:MAG: phosphotransferase, partial [Candidatus Magasanikbacteria bacterium]|nr:phosphotransferase [Candidatus Magasanikbacteria bacterium]